MLVIPVKYVLHGAETISSVYGNTGRDAAVVFTTVALLFAAVAVLPYPKNIRYILNYKPNVSYAEYELIGKKIEVLIPNRFHKAHVGHRANFEKKPENRPKDFHEVLMALRPIRIWKEPKDPQSSK